MKMIAFRIGAYDANLQESVRRYVAKKAARTLIKKVARSKKR